MVFLTAFAVGLLAIGLRSVVGYVMSAVMIVMTFGLATLTSAGSASWLLLGQAMVGYNVGIAAALAGTYAMTRFQHA